MPVELYAALLLILRAVSVVMITSVIRKQVEMRGKKARSQEVANLREDMYRLAILALAVNFVPIVIDVLTIFGLGQRPDTIPFNSVIYTFSYAFGTLLLTAVIWRMYKRQVS